MERRHTVGASAWTYGLLQCAVGEEAKSTMGEPLGAGSSIPSSPPVDNCAATQEEAMQTPWQVRRTLVAQHAGARRWDDAYQFLLRWTLAPNAAPAPALLPFQAAISGIRVLLPG